MPAESAIKLQRVKQSRDFLRASLQPSVLQQRVLTPGQALESLKQKTAAVARPPLLLQQQTSASQAHLQQTR